jgi:hypothetical protein
LFKGTPRDVPDNKGEKACSSDYNGGVLPEVDDVPV